MDATSAFRPSGSPARVLSPEALPGLVGPGKLVYVPGSTGAPTVFMSQLLRDPELTWGARLMTTYVPGINALDLSGLNPTAQVSGLFMHTSASQAQREGRYRTLPLSYSGFVRHLVEDVDIDLAVVQVSPPDRHGNCSLGPAVEFMPTVLRKCRRVLGLINSSTPALPQSVSVPYARFDHVCEVDSPLPVYEVRSDATTEAIARHVAALVEDGCALQVGLGKVPTALMRELRDRRGLRLHSGLLSDGLLELAEAGALDMAFTHTTCVLAGSARLYEQVADFAPLRIVGCDVTHDLPTLAALERFIAVNSALEVDLFGQCNLEHNQGAAVSGAGGAPDFARGARLSRGGRSIVALPARHSGGSRIVASLPDPRIASLSRIDVDYVVTEFGAARLTGASVHERAEALIEVAAPEFRESLRDAWRETAARL